MCKRFNLWSSATELAEFFGLFREPGSWSPKYNISPMQRTLVIRVKADGNRYAERMQWGLVPAWANEPSIGFEMINTRADHVTTRRTYNGAYRQRRCLIPATGYYEWQKLKDNIFQPWHVFPRETQSIAFAGLWETWRASDRTALCSCTIITTEPNRVTKPIANQMPVVLSADKWDMWLNPTLDCSPALAKMLIPCPNAWLEKTPVSNFVNHLGNNSPECIRSVQKIG